MYNLRKNYGPMAKFWLGHRLYVNVDNPDDVKTILNSNLCLDKGDAYDFINNIVGKGLLTLDGVYYNFCTRTM